MSAAPKRVSDVTIRIERPDRPDVVSLIDALDQLSIALYPPESNHLVGIATLCRPNVTFFVARDRERAVGCGAVLFDDRGWGEIKRMFVLPAMRGAGIGAQVLGALEQHASHRDIDLLRLETGIHNHEALASYRRAGYRECGPFGDYAPDPLSVFMEKRLG